MSRRFDIATRSSLDQARTATLHTAHGRIETPVFMPVGTRGTVKAMTPEELQQLGARIILANTFHLYLRPGAEIIAQLGGLHNFMHWELPILTDSGGFQIFSLKALMDIKEEGIRFRSPYDGSEYFLSPEEAVRVQNSLGADIIVTLDECLPYPSDFRRVQQSVEMTLRWAERGRQAHQQSQEQALFAIIQGSTFSELRSRSAEHTAQLDFPGYAIGGLSVGEPRQLTWEMLEASIAHLPLDKPRYLMGVGTPLDIIEAVERGVDMFDCVLPTRNARNGQVFIPGTALSVKRSEFKDDSRPIQEDCSCYTCRHYSRAYLRHLYLSREILASRLNTTHNLHFYLHFMQELRQAINEGSWPSFKAAQRSLWSSYQHETSCAQE